MTQTQSTKFMIGFFTVALVVLSFALGNSTERKVPPASAKAAPEPEPETTRKWQVEISSFKWHKGGFDSVMELNFTVRNSGPKAVKDIQITCVHGAASGTIIDTNTRTLYDVVPANSKKKFSDFNMGFIDPQVRKSYCSIDSFTVVYGEVSGA